MSKEDEGPKENEEAAPVDLHMHCHARAHAERAVTTARVTHSFTNVGITMHSFGCFPSMKVLEAEATEKFICSKCKLDSDKKYRCLSCGSKLATVSKMFSNWPLEMFQELSEDAQVAFWRSGARNRQQIKLDLTVGITAEKVEQEVKRKTGKFLPESVWAAQGYKTDKIVANCENKWDEKLEETVYMLTVEEVVEEKIRKDVLTMIEAKKDTGFRGKLSHFCSPSPSKPKEKKERKRRRSSSSSSKSSSSSSNSKPTPPKKSSTPLRCPKAARQALSLKAKEAKLKAKEQALSLKAKANEQALLAKKDQFQAKEEAARLKKKADEEAKKERRLACMCPLQKHAVTTAWLCFPARSTLCAWFRILQDKEKAKLAAKEEQDKAKLVAKVEQDKAKEKAKKFALANKVMNAAIDLLKNPLKDFQEAMRTSSGGMDEYSIQMNTLLTSRCKAMMEEAMKFLITQEEEQTDLTFTLADVKSAQAELLSKTRILV